MAPRLFLDGRIDLLRDAQIFSTVNANSDYWKIEIDGCNKDKMMLGSYHRPQMFIQTMLGLKNALLTSESTMARILLIVNRHCKLV